MREVRALLSIDHNNVVKLHGIGTHENYIYEVLEYVEGTNGTKFVNKNWHIL